MSTHSSLVGGSNADRLLNCPGSWQRTRALPPTADRPSEYAAEGSFAHEVMAWTMGGLSGPSVEFVQSIVGVKVGDREVTQDHIDSMILPALAALDELQAFYGGGFKVVAIERSVDFPGIPAARGTCDLILASKTHVLHVDWKFGQGVPVSVTSTVPVTRGLGGAVTVEEEKVNAQLLFYVAAAMHSIPAVYAGKKHLVAAIIQPRSDTPLSHTVISRKEISFFIEDLQNAVVKALDRDPPLHRGEHCRWCPAKIACPLWTAPMLILAGSNGVKPRTEMVSGEFDQYGEYLANAKTLVDMLTIFKKDIDEQLHAYLEDGGKVPGWRLKARTRKRQWVDEKTVEEVLLGLGFGMSEIWRSELQTFTATDATAKRLGVVVPGSLRQTPPTDETTVCRTDDPAPEVTKPLAIEQFRAALQSLVKS